MVRFHTTVGQTSEHDSAVCPQDSTDTLIRIDSSNKKTDLFHSSRNESGSLSRPPLIPPPDCRASTADYTLLSELALSLLPAAGVKVSPLNSLCVIITDAEVVAGAARR